MSISSTKPFAFNHTIIITVDQQLRVSNHLNKMSPSGDSSVRRRNPWEYTSSAPDFTAHNPLAPVRADGSSESPSPSPSPPSPTQALSIDPRQRVSPLWYLESPHSSSPNPHARVQYCVPCHQERASPGYIERVARLFDRLYCAGCQTDHAVLFFSHSARKSEPRRCIAHEGFYIICPHLKLSLQDIKAAKWRQAGLKVRCQEPACLFTEATITYNPTYLACAWSIKDEKLRTSAGSLDRDTAKLQGLHQSFPPLFCPHFQVSPERLFHLGCHSTLAYSRWHRCNRCFASVDVTKFGVIQNITSSHLIGYVENQKDMMEKCTELLDPDTYGHFQNPDTKYITWCDDRSCATTCELKAFSALGYLTTRYPDNSFRESYGEGMDTFDAIVHRGFGINRQGSHWREGYSWKAWAKDMLGNLLNAR